MKIAALSRAREIVIRVWRRDWAADIILAELTLIACDALAIEVPETLRE